MNIFLVVCTCFSLSVFAQSTESTRQPGTCQQLQKHAVLFQLNSVRFFDKEKSPIFISICRDAKPKVFEQFFAYLHTSNNQSDIIPKAGLNRIMAVTKPDHKIFATGVVALKKKSIQQERSQQEDTGIYQLRMRIRINDGDFTDLAVDMEAQEGKVVETRQKGFSITLAKPVKTN